MTMRQKGKFYLFLTLLALLALITLRDWLASPEMAAVLLADVQIKPLDVENPSLRMDKLERIHKVEYSGGGRNIFDRRPPPPHSPPPAPAGAASSTPQGTAPPPEPPLQVPFKYYGYVSDPRTGRRRGCFTNGEEVWIVAEGELIQGRFKLLRIGNTVAELEEVNSGRKATLPLEEIPGTAPPA